MTNLKRNDLCSCGSGNKYKKCCLPKLNEGEMYSQKIEVKATEFLKDYKIEDLRNDEVMDRLADSIREEQKWCWDNFGVTKLNINTDKEAHNHKQFFPHEIKYKTKMFETFGSKDKFFHLTSPLNADRILKEGLKGCNVRKNTVLSNKDEIYLVESDSPKIWNYVGYNQLTTGQDGFDIVVLEINKEGIEGEMFAEECAEYPSPLHTMVKQSIIHPKWIRKICMFKTSRKMYQETSPILGQLKVDFYLTNIELFENKIGIAFA